MSLFLLTFLLLYGGMHFYAYRKLAAAFLLPLPAVVGVALFMAAMAHKATPKKCADVLMHMMGHLKEHLSSDEKQELIEVINLYRRRLFPLAVPVTLLRHHVRKYGVSYLARQHFLDPHPVELMLRNHA